MFKFVICEKIFENSTLDQFIGLVFKLHLQLMYIVLQRLSLKFTLIGLFKHIYQTLNLSLTMFIVSQTICFYEALITADN